MLLLLGLLGCATTPGPGATPRPADARFDVVVLGGSGGLDEGDLTSVLVSRAGRGEYLALDVGTLYAGLVRAAQRGAFADLRPSKWNDAATVLKDHLHGYFVSHPHLDHVAGLVIGSPEDTQKRIFGLAPTLEALRAHVFLSPLWANFLDEGPGAINRYHLERLTPGTPVAVPGAELRVEAHELSHGADVTSTAFLVEADDAALLYLGDTGPDAVEQQGKLAALWARVAPLVREGRLRAVFLEASYPDPRDERLLFGHLTPRWIIAELDALAAAVRPEAPGHALRGLHVVVTHIKPRLERGADAREEVRRQLAPLEARGVRVIVPEPGVRLAF